MAKSAITLAILLITFSWTDLVEGQPDSGECLPKKLPGAGSSWRQCKILFVSTRASDRSGRINSEVYVMNPDGTGLRNLTNHPSRDTAPAWSPDGKKIAFQRLAKNTGDNWEICVMNADGSDLKELTNSPSYDVLSSWSPDSKKIAFSSRREGNWEIYIMNPDGTELRALTKDPATDRYPRWSPYLHSDVPLEGTKPRASSARRSDHGK